MDTTFKGLLGNTIGNFTPTPRGSLGGLAAITGSAKPSKKIDVKYRLIYGPDLDVIRGEVLHHLSDIPTVCVRHSKLTLRTPTTFKNLRGVYAYQAMPFSELQSLISTRIDFVQPLKDGSSKPISVPKDVVSAVLNTSFHVHAPSQFGLRVVDKNEACIELNAAGTVEASESNLEVLLLHDPSWEGLLLFNVLAETVERGGRLPSNEMEPESATLTTADCNELVIWLAREYGVKANAKAVERTLRQIAEKHGRYHPVLQYFESLPQHDGEPRLDTWLVDLFGAECSLCKGGHCEYLQKVSRWFLLSAISRAFTPGCQSDYVLTLESKQGTGKTSGLAALVGGVPGDVFSSTKLDFKSKDRFIQLRGNWLYCLDELAYSEVDPDMLKNFITDRADNYRGVFATENGKVKRRCVLCATVNPKEDKAYLKSEDRRWWPVKVKAIDIKRIEAERDQLWAEAVEAYNEAKASGEVWWPESAEDKELFNQHIAAVAASVAPSLWDDRVLDVVTRQICADVQRAIELARRLRETQLATGLSTAALAKAAGGQDVTKRTHITVDGVLEALGVPITQRSRVQGEIRASLKKLGLSSPEKTHRDALGRPGRGYLFERDDQRRRAIAAVLTADCLRAFPHARRSEIEANFVARLLEPQLDDASFLSWAHGEKLGGARGEKLADHLRTLPLLQQIAIDLELATAEDFAVQEPESEDW